MGTELRSEGEYMKSVYGGIWNLISTGFDIGMELSQKILRIKEDLEVYSQGNEVDNNRINEGKNLSKEEVWAVNESINFLREDFREMNIYMNNPTIKKLSSLSEMEFRPLLKKMGNVYCNLRKIQASYDIEGRLIV